MPIPNNLEKYIAKRVRTALDSGKWKEYKSIFEKVANDYSNITWQDICVTGAIESGFDPNAHNSSGFTGMFQTKIGNVAPNVRSKYGVSSNSDLYDVEKAAGCCAAHLSTVFSQAIKRLSNRSDISQNIKKVLGWSEYHRGYKDGGVLYELITHNLSFEDAVIKANPMRPTDPDGTYVVTILDALEYLGASFSLSNSNSQSNTGFTGLTEIPTRDKYPWFNDADIRKDESGKMYANISLISSLSRFKLIIGVGGGGANGEFSGGAGGRGLMTSGGKVLNPPNFNISGIDSSGEYHVICWRYAQYPVSGLTGISKDGKRRNGDNIDGVIYDAKTNDILCYTIEDSADVTANKFSDSYDHEILPHHASWETNSPWHKGPSSYCAKLAGGKGGFHPTLAMLCLGGRESCLFHPGADVGWSLGCILCGEKSQNGRRPNCSGSAYQSIESTNNPDVLYWKRFYDIIVPKIANGTKVKIHFRTQLGALNASSAQFSGGVSGGNIGAGLVSIRKSVDSAGVGDVIIIRPMYATTINFGGKVMPGYRAGQTDLYFGKSNIGNLISAAKYMKEKYPQYKLMIWDAYRPWAAADSWGRDYPQWAGKFIARVPSGQHSKSKHCKGCAIDLTLTDSSGNPLPMYGNSFNELDRKWARDSGGFDEFGQKAHSNPRHKNQKILRDIMMNGGKMDDYGNEYWHFETNKFDCDGSTNY